MLNQVKSDYSQSDLDSTNEQLNDADEQRELNDAELMAIAGAQVDVLHPKIWTVRRPPGGPHGLLGDTIEVELRHLLASL